MIRSTTYIAPDGTKTPISLASSTTSWPALHVHAADPAAPSPFMALLKPEPLPFNTPLQIVAVEPGHPLADGYDRVTFAGPDGTAEVRLKNCRLPVGMWTALLPDPDPGAAVFLSPVWTEEAVRARLP